MIPAASRNIDGIAVDWFIRLDAGDMTAAETAELEASYC